MAFDNVSSRLDEALRQIVSDTSTLQATTYRYHFETVLFSHLAHSRVHFRTDQSALLE